MPRLATVLFPFDKVEYLGTVILYAFICYNQVIIRHRMQKSKICQKMHGGGQQIYSVESCYNFRGWGIIQD